MYQESHKWDDAIRVADTSRHADAEVLKRSHYQWLLQTSQEDKAAAVKENEGDILGAITLYLKGGLPAKAAQVICIAVLASNIPDSKPDYLLLYSKDMQGFIVTMYQSAAECQAV